MTSLLLVFALFAICHCSQTVVIVGPTGAGKSSLINFLWNDGTKVAAEGVTFDSETLNVNSYHIPAKALTVFDTPGLLDTTGYSNEEITALIQSELLQKSHKSVIDGVVLLFDGTQNRFHLRLAFDSLIHIFGPNILKNLMVAFNKNDKIQNEERAKIKQHVVEILGPIQEEFNIDDKNLQSRVIFIDTKGDYSKYADVLYKGMADLFKAGAIDIIESDKKLKEEIEKYYQMELKDDKNYNIKTEKVAHSEEKQRTVTVNVATPYSYQCNPHRICTNRIKFIVGSHCVSRRTVYDTCWGTKDVPTPKSETYIDVWYEDVTTKNLKYEKEYLRQKAAKLVSNKIKSKIYAKYKKEL